LHRWRRFVLKQSELRAFRSVIVASACVIVALLARLALASIGTSLAFPTFYPAIVIAALAGGIYAGLLAILLSMLAAWWALIPPAFAFTPITPDLLANFALFGLCNLLLVGLTVAYRRLLFALEDNENERNLLTRELEHRSKNVISVVSALVCQTVLDEEVAKTLIERVRVASDTDDLLKTSKMRRSTWKNCWPLSCNAPTAIGLS
jgi:K+-sensing histidine kinase KdpD